MHYHGVSNGVPNVRMGAVRLWDSGVAWAILQPTPDAINWAPLDAAVDNALAAGIPEIQYAFGHTPLWAAAQPNLPGPIGNGSASEPANIAYFTNFARAMAERYRGRITSYDMWNEANLKIYWTGTSKQLAELVIQGSRAIKSADPNAKVLAPSITYGAFTRRPKYWKDFAARMKKARWPIDAANVHPYSKTPNYLTKRANTIKKTKAFYRKYGFKGPIWDTEVNYGDRRGLGQGLEAGRLQRRYRGRDDRPDLRRLHAQRRVPGLLVRLGLAHPGHRHDRPEHQPDRLCRDRVPDGPGLDGLEAVDGLQGPASPSVRASCRARTVPARRSSMPPARPGR